MDVFISYSSAERDEAHYIDSVLRKNGVSTWIAPESIPAGSNYTKAIPAAIKECKVFVLVLSQNAQSSIWVSAELENAFKNGKFIIPFLIENCPITDDFDFLISRSQRIEAYEKKSEALESLVNSIKAVLGVDTKVVEEVNPPVVEAEPAKKAEPIKVVNPVEEKTSVTEKSQPHFQRIIDKYGVYEGEVVDGVPHGKGKKTYNNGSVFVGNYVEGKWHGHGRIDYHDGTYYDGDYVEDKRHGKGTLTSSRGWIYVGDFVNGMEHGHGKCTFNNGTVKNGAWIHGEFVADKYSTIICKRVYISGDVYEGEMVKDAQNGKGKMIYTNGDIYEGDWIYHKKHGKGKYTFANGDCYEGDFFNGERHGYGKLTRPDGTVKEGQWENDEFIG